MIQYNPLIIIVMNEFKGNILISIKSGLATYRIKQNNILFCNFMFRHITVQ